MYELGNQKLILPSFKPSKWLHKERYVCEPLLQKSDVDNPLIGYGYDNPNSFDFILREALNTQQINTIRNLARENLKQIQISWQKLNIASLTMLNCSGKYFSSEKVLDTDFMCEAQKALNTKILIFSIPKKGALNIINGIVTTEKIAEFAKFTSWYYHKEDGSSALSKTLFVSQDGNVVGYVQLESKG